MLFMHCYKSVRRCLQAMSDFHYLHFTLRIIPEFSWKIISWHELSSLLLTALAFTMLLSISPNQYGYIVNLFLYLMHVCSTKRLWLALLSFTHGIYTLYSVWITIDRSVWKYKTDLHVTVFFVMYTCIITFSISSSKSSVWL